MSRHLRTSVLPALAALLLHSPALHAQPATATPPAAEPQRPGLQLPDLSGVELPLSRQVRAANALLGLSRQRLALVVGSGQPAPALTLATAPRDTQAVAAALRAGGFVVMVREDLGADALRAALKEFAQRLQPGGVGFAYVTGFGVHVDGSDLLLTRGLQLGTAADPAQLRAAGVPMQALADALQGTAESPRYLVVDAAHVHPALAAVAPPALTDLTIHAGTLGLFASPPRRAVAPAEAEALAAPVPTDPRRIAASAFGRELVRSLVTPKLSGPDMLRITRGAVLDVTLGRQEPVLVGDTRDRDEFGVPSLLDAFLPTSPEDLAREALARARHLERGSRPAGEAAPPEPPADAGVPGRPADLGTAAASGAAAVAGAAALATASAAAGTATAVAGAAGTAAALGAVGAPLSAGAGLAGGAAGVVAAAAATLASTDPTDPTDPSEPGPAATAPPAPARPPAAPAVETRTQSARGGGERPTYVARRNAYGHAEGDTLMYRTIDTWKDEVVGSTLLTIETVLDDGDLVAEDKQTQLDAQGRFKRIAHAGGGSSQFIPAQELWWANPKRGESRDVNFTELFSRADRSRGKTEWKGEMRVGRARTIELPAGEFEVLPIEGSGWYHERVGNGPPVSGQWSRTVWYSPKLGQPVAIDIEDTNAVGKLLRRERVELMHAQTARGGD